VKTAQPWNIKQVERNGGLVGNCIENPAQRENGQTVLWIGIVTENGSVDWYSNGKRHRIDGPALTWPKGAKVAWEWWVNDEQVKIY
jgi:hypothetical protein